MVRRFSFGNRLMFSRSASDLVHVVVLVINCYWVILPNFFWFRLKKVNAGLKKPAKTWFLNNSFMTNITYNHLPQISFVDFFDVHYFVLELTTFIQIWIIFPTNQLIIIFRFTKILLKWCFSKKKKIKRRV